MPLTTTPTGWFGQLKIITLQAEHMPALQPFSSKNAFCGETLSCPAIAVGHHNTIPGLTVPTDFVHDCILN